MLKNTLLRYGRDGFGQEVKVWAEKYIKIFR